MRYTLAVFVAAATVGSGCDRIVNLTPSYDAVLPVPDSAPDGNHPPDARVLDGSPSPDGGFELDAPPDGGFPPDSADGGPDLDGPAAPTAPSNPM